MLASDLQIDQETIATGVTGVDELLEGRGLPRGSVVFIVGGPGTGKTTLGLQFLCDGARHDEYGVYVSLDEPLDSLLRHTAKLGLEVGEFAKKGKISMVAASPPISTAGGGVQNFLLSPESALASLVKRISAASNSTGNPPRTATRIVVDSLATLILQFPGPADRRLAIKGIIETVRPLNCTTLLVSELSHSSIEREYAFEEFLADGVFIMRSVNKTGHTIHTFTIEKMRGVDHDKLAHPYRITRGGIQVFPTEVAIY